MNTGMPVSFLSVFGVWGSSLYLDLECILHFEMLNVF